MVACELLEGIPKNAYEIGKFKSGDPIFECFDSRRKTCKYCIDYKTNRGNLMICGYLTNCKNMNETEDKIL